MKVCISTYGCVANKDNESIIRGLLKGYEFVNESEADVVILNTCIVKSKTENKMYSKIRSLGSKRLIITGCMPAYDSSKLRLLPNITLVSTQNITRIKDAIENRKDYLEDNKESKLNLPKVVLDVPIIQISEGCVNTCNYCGTKLAKGTLRSSSIEEIKKEVIRFKDYKRINLTATDTGCYGFDLDLTMVDLLKELVKVKGDFKLRVGMMNPSHVKEYLDPLIEVFKNKKIFPFIHIPVQSGSNKVLKEMNRRYTVEGFKEIVNKFREAIPKISIATDVIVGYPTESYKDFLDTVSLIKEIKPEVFNLSKYSSRKGTFGSKLKPLKSQEVKKRSEILDKVYKELKFI